jgi:hypothetical protein
MAASPNGRHSSACCTSAAAPSIAAAWNNSM